MNSNLSLLGKSVVNGSYSNPLKELKANLENGKRNTSRMLLKIENFESKLTDLDLEMSEFQKKTYSYTKAKENIGLTLIEIEKTSEFYRVADVVEPIIDRGLNLDNDTHKDFFECITRLINAKRYFQERGQKLKNTETVMNSIEKVLQVLQNQHL
jgi:hypothetical protein